MTPTAGRRVMLDRRDSDGTMYREVSLTADGRLHISGQDLGPGVERYFGAHEYIGD